MTSLVEQGTKLLHYRLIEHLGAGGMGVVWKAIDTTLDRDVAIKILPETFAQDPERLARFEREAKLLASLNHPNVAAVYGLHEHNGVRFLAMELVRGQTLTAAIREGLDAARVLELASAIADGLAAAHRQRVIHRDLKPDNIVIDPDGRPKILDFGLAKLGAVATPEDTPTIAGEQLAVADHAITTRKGTIVGTVAYMSPEQAQGAFVDLRSDIFSFGIVLYEMTTGRRPFSGSNPLSILTSILRDTPAPLKELAPLAPPPLDGIVRRCLAKSPDARYANASAVRDDLLALRGELASDSGRVTRVTPLRSKKAWIAAAAAAVIVLAVIGAGWFRRHASEQWLRGEALPQLEAIVERVQPPEEGRESWDAFVLARRIDAVAPHEQAVERLRAKFTREVDITSDPPGATVSVRYYDEPDAAPLIVGKTPLTKVPFPKGFTRVHLELPGMRAVDDVVWNSWLVGSAWSYQFDDPATLPESMIRVPAGTMNLSLPGFDNLTSDSMNSFFMDRHEVTNREYKRFVDDGGYRSAKHWHQPFLDGAKSLTPAEAMVRFVDRTGRPGPSTWEVGSYPNGLDDYPVGGVSWYEAAAYADWAGKSLPTMYHWSRVAFTFGSSRIVPMANLDEKGPRAVSNSKSMNRFGATDLAGNVREWTWNATDGGRGRFLLGGGWNDEDWRFSDAYAQPAFDRSATNGFRCIRLLGEEPNAAVLQHPINARKRDFLAEKPVSDAVFAQYLRQFAYDKTPLDAKIEETTQTPAGVRQKISFAAAYGRERMLAYLFLPTSGSPPFQTVILFPGGGAVGTRSSTTLDAGRVDFIPKSGRALLLPLYKGTYERGGDLKADYPEPTIFYKDYVIMWGKDLSRAIDYIESRKDLDSGRIAYYGISWGGAMGALLPATEPRIKTNILYVAGFNFRRALPEVDAINYVRHVKQPTLILNGEFDYLFPTETSQRPLFELLGTPPEHKRRMVFPGGHSVPRTEMIKHSLLWLDQYLGPVR